MQIWHSASVPPQSFPKHLLFALLFLRHYDAEHINATLCGVDEQTFRKWCWYYVKQMAFMSVVCVTFIMSSVLTVQIQWNRRLRCQPVEGCRVTVDGTDFRINEPTPFSRIWYSHKFKGPGLRYEVGVSLMGDIVWVSGPFACGSNTDLTIFRSGMKKALLPGERVIADRGYNDDHCAIPSRLTPQGRAIAAELRARHETCNGRFKTWRILSERFRHHRSKHSFCFHAIANITQLLIEVDPLFHVNCFN